MPIIIGNRVRSFALRGITALLQSYFFESIPEIVQSPKFEKLVAVCGGTTRSGGADHDERLTSLQRLDRWYGGIEAKFGALGQIRAFSLAFATAVFENGPLAEVERLGEELVALLSSAECDDTVFLDVDYPRRTRPVLTLLECEIQDIPHPALGVEQTLVRFQDPERALALLRFAWTDFGPRRAIIGDWCKAIVEKASAEGQMRIGFALGTLAQTKFIDVFEQILNAWLFSESRQCQSVADIALNVAAFDSAPATAIRRIVENWAQSGTQEEVAASVKLACGFAGTRIRGLAIETLRTVARRREWTLPVDLFETMRDCLTNLMNLHARNSDNSLFDLPRLILELASRVTEEVSGSEQTNGELKKSPFPLLLFLSVVDELPLSQKEGVHGHLSLDSLMKDEETARLTAKIFNEALVRHRIGTVKPREFAQAIIRRWVDRRHRDKSHYDARSQIDPLLRLACFLVETAPTDDDVDRVTYLFESLYSAEALRSDNVIEHVPREG